MRAPPSCARRHSLDTHTTPRLLFTFSSATLVRTGASLWPWHLSSPPDLTHADLTSRPARTHRASGIAASNAHLAADCLRMCVVVMPDQGFVWSRLARRSLARTAVWRLRAGLPRRRMTSGRRLRRLPLLEVSSPSRSSSRHIQRRRRLPRVLGKMARCQLESSLGTTPRAERPSRRRPSCAKRPRRVPSLEVPCRLRLPPWRRSRRPRSRSPACPRTTPCLCGRR